MRIPSWQDPLFNASIGIATLLDEIDAELGADEHDILYEHAATVQRYITRLEGILYKEKTNNV